MDVNKIGSTNNIQSTNELNKVRAVPQAEQSAKMLDKVNVSEDAKVQALYKKAMAKIKEAPDLRMDKIEEAKKLLESFSNPSNEILEAVSKKLLGKFGIG